MVVRIGELWQAVIVRSRFLALVDRGIEVDEVPAWFTRCLHDDLDIALAVESAGVAADGVVIDDGVDVGGLGPADAFQAGPRGGARRATRDLERQCSSSD